MRRFSRSVLVLSMMVAACAPGSPSGKVRILNLFSADGGAGPAVDVYAAPRRASEALDPRSEPILRGVEYAKLSSYLTPLTNEGNVGVLVILEAGKKSGSPWYRGEVVPGAFAVDDQALLLLRNCPDALGTPTVCSELFFESGPAERAAPMPRPDAGAAMFYERSSALAEVLPGRVHAWSVGGACLPGQRNDQVTGYEVPAGPSTLVLSLKSGSGTPTCSEPPSLSLPINPTPGQRAWLLEWGTSPTDLHVAWVPIP